VVRDSVSYCRIASHRFASFRIVSYPFVSFRILSSSVVVPRRIPLLFPPPRKCSERGKQNNNNNNNNNNNGNDNDNDNGNDNGNDSSYYGRVGLSGRGFDTVLHQRRHVRKSITSMIYTTPFGTTPKRGRWSHRLYKTFVGTHVPLDTAKSIEYMGLQMYVEWQLFVKAIADGHFCVEDLLLPDDVSVSVPIVERIFASAGLAAPDAQAVRAALARVDPRANTRKHRPTLTWEEIFAIDKHYAQIARDLSKEYGYD